MARCWASSDQGRQPCVGDVRCVCVRWLWLPRTAPIFRSAHTLVNCPFPGSVPSAYLQCDGRKRERRNHERGVAGADADVGERFYPDRVGLFKGVGGLGIRTR